MAGQALGPDGTRAAARDRLIILLIFVACLAPVFATPVMPTIDFYDHLARYYVLSRAPHDPVVARNYAAAWGLMPNLGLDPLGAWLMGVLKPYDVARIIAVLLLAVQFSGVLALNRALFGRTSLMTAALSGILLYSYIFVWGFSNFLLGIGLAFLAAAWWVRMRGRPAAATPVAIVLALAVFLSHGLAFFFYGLLVGGLELGRWLEDPRRNTLALARSAGLLVVQAVGPAIVFLHSRTLLGQQPSGAAAQAAQHAGVLPRLTWEARHRMHAVLQVANGPSFWLDLALGAIAVAALGVLLRRGRVRISPRAAPALAILGLLMFLMPPSAMGVDYIGDRPPLVFAMLLAASLAPAAGYPLWANFVWLGLLGARLAALTLAWAHYGQDLADYREVVRPIQPGDLMHGFVVGGQDTRQIEPRCEMFRPLTVIEKGAAVPLFAFGTQQPLRLIGPLGWAETPERVAAKRDDVDRVAGVSDWLEKIASEARFRYVLLCHPERLRRPLPDNLALVSAKGEFALYSIGPSR